MIPQIGRARLPPSRRLASPCSMRLGGSLALPTSGLEAFLEASPPGLAALQVDYLTIWAQNPLGNGAPIIIVMGRRHRRIRLRLIIYTFPANTVADFVPKIFYPIVHGLCPSLSSLKDGPFEGNPRQLDLVAILAQWLSPFQCHLSGFSNTFFPGLSSQDRLSFLASPWNGSDMTQHQSGFFYSGPVDL